MSFKLEDFAKAVDLAEDIKSKEFELKKQKVETQYEDLLRRQSEIEKNKNLDLSGLSAEARDKLKGQVKDYMSHAKNSQVFLNKSFKGKVPMFARNLIFVGGESGNGKSTITANLAFSAISQSKRVLVLTNEEHTTDVFNRITCLIKGWNYSSDHSDFSEEQIQTFQDYIDILSKKLNVIDDAYGDSSGVTTTIEGIQGIMEKLIVGQIKYDLILIDYYQNIDSSSKNPGLSEWQVQERVCRYLDSFKNRYDAPIIVLGQLKAYDEEKTPFKIRIEGRKTIYNSSTTCLEIQRDSENLRSKFIVRKSRFPASLGQEIFVGFSKGRFVEYNQEFALKVESDKSTRQTQEILAMKMKRNESENK